MSGCRYIFFDVGNTLLFPNRAKMLAPLAVEKHPTLAEWQARERETKKEFDQSMLRGRVDHGFWRVFYTRLLDQLEEHDGMCDALVRNTQNSANWETILPGTREALCRIGQNYRLAVISNSDGGIARILDRSGIADCFESITDSGNLGIEKPRPEIFQAALQAMKAAPEESLYVGDVYAVDYVGATNAGMQAVLFDVCGAYAELDVPRVESLAQLEIWLKQ
ncbi:MAG TPA: HAD family hydrolase [Candidatus Binatia bacterium]|nr:HAD family hydrolase [Candidatus Binatia bacterium]